MRHSDPLYVNAGRVRAAIDRYPEGLCFAAKDGRPILVNRKMNDLSAALRGRTITNIIPMWEELTDLSTERTAEGQLIVPGPGGTVWQFTRTELSLESGTVTQLEAVDVTELYALRQKLRENNRKISEFHQRQRELLKNIVRNNLSQELLNAKMRVHDNFGRLIVVTKKLLENGGDGDEARRLMTSWENTVSDMMSGSLKEPACPVSPEQELVQIAATVGCRVEFRGEQPKQRRPLLLLYAAIREALTNAVRHAGATRLTIAIEERPDRYAVSITSDGRKDIASVTEGGGLSDLRRRVEGEGGTMEVVCAGGVALKLTLPKEG